MMEKKNRPEMKAANQHCEKSDSMPASKKTPANAVSIRECASSHELSIKPLVVKINLRLSETACYLLPVAAKSVTGRGNPCMLLATPDAMIYRVFFCVDASAQPFKAALIRSESMVALAGQSSGWPVSSNAGISTPVSVTTPYERGNSGGDSIKLLLEFIAMMTTPTQTHPKFTWRFLAVVETTPDMRPIILYANATTEEEARENFPGCNLYFAARLPLTIPEEMGVSHA